MSNKIDLRTTMHKSKIVKLGMENKVLDLFIKGFNMEQISFEIQKETGVSVSTVAIRKFLDKSKKATREIMKRDNELSKKHAEITLNYKLLLYDMLKDNQNVQRQALESEDFASYAAIGRLINTNIKLFAKLAGDLDAQNQTNVNIMYEKVGNLIGDKNANLRRDLLASTKSINIEKIVKKGNNIEAIRIQKDFRDEKEDKQKIIEVKNYEKE